MKRIHVITPVISSEMRNPKDFEMFEGDGIRITHENLDVGPSSIESEYDEALSVPDTLRKCVAAEQDGAHAIIIDCLGDPGVKPARELLRIPVFGPGEAAMHMAAPLGEKFSVVTVLDSVCPMINNNARSYGLFDKLASIRVVNTPVLEIEKNPQKLFRDLGREAIAAVREDKAHAIVLGCTGFFGCAEVIMDMLEKEFGQYIPVIDPVPAAIVTAIGVLKLDLSHSKRTYANPPVKPVVGYDIRPESVAAQ